MQEVIALTRNDCGLLSARFGQHGNSQRRMLAALEEAAANDSFARMCVLRQLEKAFDVDLGMVCYHFEHRNDQATPELQRLVMNYVAQWGFSAMGAQELRVRIDRVRDVQEIVAGRFEQEAIGEPGA